MINININKYKDTFLSEAKEHVYSMNKHLLELEKNPAKTAFVNDIFREVHTLKSMAATMNYNHTAQLCHAMEDILDALKKKKIEVEKCTDILFNCFDVFESSLKEIYNGKEELNTDSLIKKIQTLLGPNKDTRRTNNKQRTTKVEKIQSIEVKIEKLDRLMNLTEELLINKMRLDTIKEELHHPELKSAVDTLGRLLSDMQYNVMQSRMVPIGFVFNRFPRMVRDLAKDQKKEINLEMEGSDIELDRSVIDEISESMVHLLRNAVDHGIENPADRKRAKKPAHGTIKLTARRTKGFVVIEVTDDGSGLQIDNIKNTANRNGILFPNATKEDIKNSIFSGVSTAKKVTDVSGRGFGLNVVKNKIESLGGNIDVESEPQEGSTFIMEIPLTLAIIKTLSVRVRDKIYEIPLVNVERLVTVDSVKIKGMMGHEAIVLNEESIPITRLDIIFKMVHRQDSADPTDASFNEQSIVIIRKDNEKMGLAVDEFLTTQEIVLKPLNKLLRKNKYFAGSTIIGSGDVVLILDVANLMLTKRVKEVRSREVRSREVER